ncbi:conjugal transfer protein TrbE [Algimonas ampicilliniresistens]|uniref:Conjugal transfer protein TrbE n=2 Tax=Algimonas ampicilliniresistens TaxID=1298735 RepID=A0ABQ5V8H5_9PROT|nr:conjugal transfer protein TrbE [Algimonas ampicilliniresistens]
MFLREYRQRPAALADHLPWAALVAPGVILNKDGSFQRTMRFRGPDLDSSTPQELIATCARINNALRRFGSGWALHFEATRREAEGYAPSKFRDPLAWLINEERRGLNTASGALFESDYHLTFTFLPPADKIGRLETVFIDNDKNGAENASLDFLTAFVRNTDAALDLLAGVFPVAVFLSDDEMLTYLQSCLAPDKRQHVRAPDIPMHLDAVLGGVDLVGGLAPKLGGQHVRCVTVMGFPGAMEPGLLDALNGLGFPYRWTTRFLPMDKSEATKVLGRYRRQWFAKRKSVMAILKEVITNEASALVDTDADNQAGDADTALQLLGQDHVGFGYVTQTIVVSDVDAAITEARIKAVERLVNGQGFVTIRETVNAVEAWLGSIPGQSYANVRQPIIHTLNLAHMMPLSAIWAGPERNDHMDGPPLLHATTQGHTPFRLVTHQGDIGHTLIVGPTGAGKSVLLCLLALQFRRYENAQVFLFDKGRSAKVATLGMSGQHYELGGEGGLCFQPLRNIDKPQDLAWAEGWLLDLLRQEGVEVTPDIKDTVWSALNSLASAPVEERTLTGLEALLQSSHLRQAIHPYTLAGPHGSVLDADTDISLDANWQCFEMEELMHSKALVLPVLTYLFHRLEARFNGHPTLLVLDEAWVFLDDPVFADRIREWLKVLRKKNVSVIFATQSLSDVANSTIAPALIESCPSRIFLPNSRATEPQQLDAYRRFGLNDTQIQLIGQATPKRDYYFQSRAGNRLFDLTLGPIALAFCGASSVGALMEADGVRASSNGSDFAARWLHWQQLDWAADLLSSFSTHGDA